MSVLGPLVHFGNFARLHRAAHADLPLVSDFTSRLTTEASAAAPQWMELLADRTAYVLIATECNIVVGVCVMHHPASAAEARLSWLYVQSETRGRGLGTMLVGSAIEHAQSEGAANIIAKVFGDSPKLQSLLVDVGFVPNDAAESTYCLSVWNRRQSLSYCDFSVPPHPPAGGCDIAVRGLLLAMGTLNKTMLLTAQADKVLQYEVDTDRPAHGELLALSRAAARRRFSVILHAPGASENDVDSGTTATDRIVVDNEPVTPERLIGRLSRQHLPLLSLHFARLGEAPFKRWYLITGFDGYLFRLVDIAGQAATATTTQSVTAPEMRAALFAQHEAIGLTISQRN